MDWTHHAKQLFNVPKPAHFTNYPHCCECAEHDETLLTADVDTINLQQLGNPSSAELDACTFSDAILKAYEIWNTE